MQQCSLSLKNQKKLLNFRKACNSCLDYSMYKMETQKNVNLLTESDNESSKFATRKRYVINDQNNVEYGEGNENDSSVKGQIRA